MLEKEQEQTWKKLENEQKKQKNSLLGVVVKNGPFL